MRRAAAVDVSAGLSDDEVIERLTAVRGFGRWSAGWFLAGRLGRADVCPAGDLAAPGGRGRTMSEPAVRRRAAVGGGA